MSRTAPFRIKCICIVLSWWTIIWNMLAMCWPMRCGFVCIDGVSSASREAHHARVRCSKRPCDAIWLCICFTQPDREKCTSAFLSRYCRAIEFVCEFDAFLLPWNIKWSTQIRFECSCTELRYVVVCLRCLGSYLVLSLPCDSNKCIGCFLPVRERAMQFFFFFF